MGDFNPFGGWPPQAYGIWTGVLMLAGWMLNQYRLNRKLSIEDRQANREGYTKQVENLQAENRSLSADLFTLRREYDEYRKLCHAETDQLRNQIVALSDELAGLNRKFDQQAVSLARQFGVTNGGKPE